MNDSALIYGLLIRPLSSQDTSSGHVLPLVRESDHILLRMGEMSFVTKEPRADETMIYREIAEELWFHLEGAIEFTCRDRRGDSPTSGNLYSERYEDPTLLLIPSGVAFGMRAIAGPASLIRISTFEEGSHEKDQIYAWDEIT